MRAHWSSSFCLSYPNTWLCSPSGPISNRFPHRHYQQLKQSTNKNLLHCLFTFTSLLPLGRYPAPISPHNLPLSFLTYINTTHKDGSKNSAMVEWLKQPTWNPHSGNSSWKHAPQKLQKCQASDNPRAINGLQK